MQKNNAGSLGGALLETAFSGHYDRSMRRNRADRYEVRGGWCTSNIVKSRAKTKKNLITSPELGPTRRRHLAWLHPPDPHRFRVAATIMVDLLAGVLEINIQLGLSLARRQELRRPPTTSTAATHEQLGHRHW